MQNNPFTQTGKFFRGNLHGHSTQSDGTFPVQEVVNKYRECGYHFVAITDHFLECYDYPVTDSSDCRDDQFTTLISAELHLSQMENGEMWHVLAVGLPLDFQPPQKDETIVDISLRAHKAGAFIGMVHPTWNGMTPNDAAQLPFAHAVEVYNHGSQREVGRGDGWGLCDQLLNQGRRLSAFAVDDSHNFENDFLGGWVYVKADSLNPDNLLDSLKNGWYYSSQGPLIRDIQIEGERVVVKSSPARNIIICGRGSKSNHCFGPGITEAAFDLDRYQGEYFRITVTDSHGYHAWSNPIWLD